MPQSWRDNIWYLSSRLRGSPAESCDTIWTTTDVDLSTSLRQLSLRDAPNDPFNPQIPSIQQFLPIGTRRAHERFLDW
jgi:hypothetical protein